MTTNPNDAVVTTPFQMEVGWMIGAMPVHGQLKAAALIVEGRTLSWPSLGWGSWTCPKEDAALLGDSLPDAMKKVAMKLDWPLDGGAANRLLRQLTVQ
jgi:hypothetical protein